MWVACLRPIQSSQLLLWRCTSQSHAGMTEEEELDCMQLYVTVKKHLFFSGFIASSVIGVDNHTIINVMLMYFTPSELSPRGSYYQAAWVWVHSSAWDKNSQRSLENYCTSDAFWKKLNIHVQEILSSDSNVLQCCLLYVLQFVLLYCLMLF